MNSIKINREFLLIYIFILLFLSVSGSKRILADNYPETIDTKLNDEIYTGSFTLISDEDYSYFLFDPQKLKSTTSNYHSFTITSSLYDYLEIECILSETYFIDEIENKFTTSVCQDFQPEEPIANVIYDISQYKTNTNKKLIFRVLGSAGNTLTFYFRTSKSYTTSLDFKTIENAFAYTCIAVKISTYTNLVRENQYYLQSSEVDSIVTFGVGGGENILLETNTFILLTNQTLTKHYMSYDTVYFFIGKPKQSSDADNILQISSQTMPVGGDNYYYFVTYGVDTQNYITFHHECSGSQKYYIAVNYQFANQDFYVTVNTLLGTKQILIADSFEDQKTFPEYEYRQVIGLSKINRNDFHFHVYKLECDANATTLVANLKYNTKDSVSISLAVDPGTFKEGLITFKTTTNFIVGYNDCSELKIEIFIENSNEKKTFEINFEGNRFEVDNQRKIYLNRTKEASNMMLISSREEIQAYIIISASVVNTGYDESSMIYKDDSGVCFTSLARRYNVNYGGAITINNKQGTPKRICYYVSEIAIFQTETQNCLSVKDSVTLTLKQLLVKEASDSDYLTMYYNYRMYIMIYDLDLSTISFSPLEIITDLPKSTLISKQGNNYIWAEGMVSKDSAAYFSRTLVSAYVEPESIFDIYLGDSSESSYENVDFGIQCILGYEIAIPYIENLFDEQENICKIINTEDKNPRILHILCDLSHYKDIENNIVNLLIKVTSKKDVNAKFLIRSDSTVLTSLVLKKENTVKVLGPEAYAVYDFNMTELASISSKQLMLYNNETDSMKIYARYGDDYKNFKLIDRGSLLILKYKEFNSKYSNYKKFVIFMGKIGCESDTCISIINIKHATNNFFYNSLTSEFTESFRTLINIPDCQDSIVYNLVFNYFKKPEVNTMYFTKKLLDGELLYDRYIEILSTNTYNNLVLKTISEIQVMKTINQHTSIIQFKCRNNFTMNFYYFANIDQSGTEIELEEGTIKEYVIPPKKNYKFSYIGIDEIKVETLYGERKITFELVEIETEDKIVTLKRTSDITDVFYVENISADKDLIIRVTTSLNSKNFESTVIKGLYKYKGAYIFESPKNAYKINFYLQLTNKDNKDKKVCYNSDISPVIEKTQSYCFSINENTNYTYNVPNDLSKSVFYVTFYSDDSNPDAFTLVNVYVQIKENAGEDGDGGEEGSGGFAVLIIIIIILIILGIFIVAFLIISKRKTRVTSEDIEKDIKQPSSMEDDS